MKERHAKLLEYVSTQGKTDVATLAQYLDISKVTIRKDLHYLSERGIIRRERGYATLNDPNDTNYNMAFHYETKRKIAQKATSYIEEGDTIIIEAGSTCALFAEQLVQKFSALTIITNSMHIAAFIKDYPNVNIILLGGNLQPKSQALVGPLTKAAVETFRVDKIFVGTDGYSRALGFTGNDLIRSDTLHAMTACAKKTYVLTESTKFTNPGSVSFLHLDDVYEIITDSDLDQEEASFLKSQDIIITLI